ncbi:MAG: hypothetical protein MRY57_03190 [Candidatus Pacebacteria bacterium]|nr:hypothetical protein [Candidatus Paceibacterota bacterium]
MNLHFYPEKQTLILGVEEISIPEQIQRFANKDNLIKKSEFHITLVGNRTGEIILEKIAESNIAIEKLLNLGKKYNWDFSYIDKYYYMQKDYDDHTRHSIIQPITLPDLEKFYDDLEQVYGLSFSRPYPHITYFAKGDKNQGIGIYSHTDFEKFKKQQL